mgnify:CR=1 FL=1
MIIVKKSGYLKYKNFKFRCALGKAGIKKKEKEGDNVTPKGIFKITSMYYRPDRIKNITTAVKKIKIKKNMGWCDDPDSHFYNQQISLPNKFGHEKLYRNDHLYDLVVVINYNTNPITKKNMDSRKSTWASNAFFDELYHWKQRRYGHCLYKYLFWIGDDWEFDKLLFSQ